MNIDELADLLEEVVFRLRANPGTKEKSAKPPLKHRGGGYPMVQPSNVDNDDLMERAKKATVPSRSYTNTDRWLPEVTILRGKGWSWGQIYDWLKEEGEPVQKIKNSFVSSMSRRYKNFIEEETRRTAYNAAHPVIK